MKLLHIFKNILIAPISLKDEIGEGPVSIKDLKQYPFVLLNKDMSFRDHVDKYFEESGVHINPLYETNDRGIIIPFVENNCGLTFFPDSMAEQSIKDGRSFKVNLIEEMPERTISFIMNKAKYHPQIIHDVTKEITKQKMPE